MDNGDSLLDVIDYTSDFFGSQNDAASIFDLADEFLGDNEADLSGGVIEESGNLATNVNQSNVLLTSQNFAVSSTKSTPQTTLVSSSPFLTSSSSSSASVASLLELQKAASMQQQQQNIVGQAVVNPLQNLASQTGLAPQILQQGQQQFILKTASGQIQLSSQQQLQLQQQLLQHQQQQQQQQVASFQLPGTSPSPAGSSTGMLNRSGTPISGGLSISFGSPSTQTISSQLKRASPAPNVNIVHLPTNLQQQQQQQQPQNQQQQFQIAPGAFLQIPSVSAGTQNLVNTALLQGQQTIIGASQQQGTLVNTQNTVIQNPNVVNVNVAAQHVLCNNTSQQQVQQQQQQQQRPAMGLTSLQTASQSPFNIQGNLQGGQIQGTLIQTAEGKSILIPSQNIAHPINIQQLSVATPMGTQPVQQPQGNVGNMIQLAQSNVGSLDNRSANQALPQIMVNSQGQQILVQRAGASASPQQMTQNIIVRAPGGQSAGIVQFQQRAAGQQPQIQGNTQAIQALAAAAGGGQQLKIISQPGSGSQGLPMINIGGQSVSLQTLSSQLGNIPGLQLLQQQGQVTMQQQQQSGQTGHVTLQQGQAVNFQSQVSSGSTVIMQQNQGSVGIGQAGSVQPQSGVMFMAQSGAKTSTSQVTSQYNTAQMMPQPNQTVGQGQISQVKVDSSSDSVEAQTQQILQRIHNQLQMSQANSAISRASPSIGTRVASFSSATAPNVTVQHIKQEQTGSSSCFNSLSASQVIKSEPNTLEALVKQESQDSKNGVFSGSNTLSQAAAMSGLAGMLGNSGQSTSVTTTVSTATTQMSLFVVSNSSQGVVSNSSGLLNTSASFPNLANSSSSLSNNSPLMASVQQVTSTCASQTAPATLQMAGQVRPARATLQTIQLPPELQQQFQRVQQEIKKIQSMTNVTAMHKQRLQQLQNLQRHILLKGRVLATTKAEPHHIQQGLAALTQSGLTVSQSGSDTQLFASSSGQALEQQPKTQSSQVQYSASVSRRGASSGQESTLPDSTSSLGQGEGQGPILSTLLTTTTSPSRPSQPPTPSFVQSTQQSQQITNLNSSQGSSMTTQLASSVATQPGTSLNQQPGTSMTPQQGGSRTTAIETATITTTAVSSNPEVAVPTQIKIANKVLTLSLKPAQRDKVQSYLDRMTLEQQQQYLQTQQHVLSKIQKQQHINAQIMAQVEQQKKLAAAAPSGATPSSGQAQGVVTVGQALQNKALAPGSTVESQTTTAKVAEIKTIPVPVGLSQTSGTTDGATPVRGIKRSYMDIPKGTLINQQIRQDQNHAVNPDTKRPFRSRSDACRRLLRYHVFQSYGPSPSELASFDSNMEEIASELLQKKNKMFDRFRVLLMQETIRSQQSSELVMLQRMQNQELRKQIEEEKLLVKTNPGAFRPMPMRFLCKTEDGSSSQDVKLEPRSDSGAEDRTEDDDSNDAEVDHIVHHIKEERDDSDQESKTVRMKKLVIKSDGQNFRSSFKRNSLDSSHSSVEEVLDTSDYSNEGTTGDSQSGAQGRESREGFTEEDEDTNDYSDKYYSLQDEAAQAAMAISSAEESQDSQMEVEVESEVYRKCRVAGSRHNEHRGLEPGAGNKNGSLELASESIYYSNTPREDNSGTHSSKVFPSFTHKDEDYIPSHSPLSNESGEGNNIGPAAANGVGPGVENTDYLDKFNMYQPITESLTDSEENSYYSADNSAEHPSVMRGEGRATVETIPQFSDSDSEEQESDQEVKAQMESAINSILSLSQGVTNESHSVYNQSNQLFQSGGQSDSVSHNNASSSEREGFVRETNPNSDLESAVNSILM